jgi:hypothetical protein
MSEDEETEECGHCENNSHKCQHGQVQVVAVDPQQIKKGLERETWAFINKTPFQLLVRAYNLQRQAIVEVTFSEKAVPNPEVEKQKVDAYVR